MSIEIVQGQHIITTEPVPFKYQLRPDYVYVVLERRTKDKTFQFQLPLQLTPQEAGLLIYQIKGGVWQLDEEGYPVNYSWVWEVCKQFCKSVQQGIGLTEV